jgi:succinate dehydrogenase / fumarate reductase flavoprotein subunit
MESVRERVDQLVSSKGKRSSRSYHKELGQIMWEYAGMARNEKGLNKAIGQIQDLRDDFNKNLLVPGSGNNLNAELERAGRVRDFLDFGELLCRDALERNESCGGHFREEHQTEDGEAVRDDENFAHAAVWEFDGDGKTPNRHQEKLTYDNVKLAVRSYK